jgi:putative component of membrane protein insertase Oxa1/YidC/SpoIIIJ protein YidD
VIQLYGPVRGLRKAVWRLLRCNPFSQGGIDDPMPAGGDAS